MDEPGTVVPLVDSRPRPTRSLALRLVSFAGQTPPDVEIAEATAILQTGARSFAAFYAENSYGMQPFEGEVFGWYEVPGLEDPFSGGCPSTEGLNLLFSEDADEDAFDHLGTYWPNDPDCLGTALGAQGSVGDPERTTSYNGSLNCRLLVQEVGHNFGLHHSMSYQCRDEDNALTAYSDNCSSAEYGHPFDPMGSGPCGHFAAYQKAYMGWLQECNNITVTGDGRYNLLPLELPCDGTQSLRIPIGDGLYYSLEYRQPIGVFDGPNAVWPEGAGLSGVLVYVVRDYAYDPSADNQGPTGRLLDMTPGSGGANFPNAPQGIWGDHTDAFMPVGDTYQDYLGRVEFTVESVAETHAVIVVSFPDGGEGTATCDGGGLMGEDGDALGSLLCSADREPPTVAIVDPSDGDILSGDPFSVTAEAADNGSVVDVELLMDGVSLGADATSPYVWNIPALEEGEYTFIAEARDAAALQTESTPVTILVSAGAGSTGTGDDSAGTGADDGDAETDGTDAAGSGSGSGGAQSGEGEGCGCRSSTDSSPFGWLLLGSIAWFARRRSPRVHPG